MTRQLLALAPPALERPPLSEVIYLDRPRADASLPAAVAPLRLTRRGLIVSALLVVVVACALIGVAWLSAPGAGAAGTSAVPSVVTVRAGDTLWGVARAIAPVSDPRVVVDELRRVNHLRTDDLVPGQVLRTH
ncbi:MAG TPA: LysM peptidoglycan-binding domain-containing protein [Jatrophihabitantaceae bacterium]|nr:LysM peptidoglycan-binding domain-containing protein [Jatrophihabitantaceae bacterium]